MSIGYVGEVYPLVGGWFGEDGQSLPDDFTLLDGWFGEVDCSCDYLLQRVALVEDLLRECEPIYVGTDGHLHEIDIGV